jgi:hypothetical protein
MLLLLGASYCAVIRGGVMRMRLTAMIVLATICFVDGSVVADDSNMLLARWERGVSVQPIKAPDMKVYLWFYEWHMFDAVDRGQHTRGAWNNRITIGKDGQLATVASSNPGITLEITSATDGAEMKLTIANDFAYLKYEHPIVA